MATERRLIDANELLKVLKHRVKGNEDSGIVLGTNSTLGIMEEWVRSIPTVDAVEVVHGRCDKSVMKDEWYGHIYTCKECEYQCMVDDGTGNEVEPNFCPNCGAKMDGERRTDNA